ncbi:MAG: hypothetical protein LBI44_01435 [Oscillospiraceae bacterium]|jgi:hypothetical protein|nr:hypothetical protein [Oscillospiraceae bacterium]
MKMINARARDNRGSATVTVLIALAFITILGSVLLFITYTGYRIKVAQYHAYQNFSRAEIALNEIKAGVGHIVSDCIAEAYTEVMADYQMGMDIESAFLRKFTEKLLKYEIISGVSSAPLFPDLPLEAAVIALIESGGFCQYDIAQLVNNVPGFDNDGGRVTVTGVTANPLAVITPGSGGRIILQGIVVTHTTDDSFTTTVTSDIAIAKPTFDYVSSHYSMSGIPDFALIAKEQLVASLGSYTITGNAYAGAVQVFGSPNGLTFKEGTAVVGGYVGIGGAYVDGDVTVRGSFTIDTTASLWANRLIVEDFGRLELLNAAYIADDLDLRGNSAYARIRERYYGFGTGGLASQSSAIVVNGQNTTLDMSGIRTLQLGGQALININEYATGATVPMGQSIAVKGDQLAYLIPQHAIAGGSNPVVFQNDDPPTFITNSEGVISIDLDKAVDLSAELWPGTPISDYIASNSGVQPVLKPLGSTGYTMLYFFMRFDDKSKANEYFLDYFGNNKSSVRAYLEQYFSVYRTAGLITSGAYIYNWDSEASDEVELLWRNASVSAEYARAYDNRRRTLSSSIPAPDGVTPYEYVVNTDMMDALPNGTTLLFYDGVTPVAAVYKGVANPATTGLSAVISSGDITVSGAFTGLVISGKNISVSGNITKDRAKVLAALKATNAQGETFASYLRNVGVDDSSTGNPAWDMDALVFYDNWRRS